MLAPMNPMIHAGDADGEDCLFARLYVDDFKMSNATITLVPVNGGLSFSREARRPRCPGPRALRGRLRLEQDNNRCASRRRASLVKGTLLVTPDGMNGFKTDLVERDGPDHRPQHLGLGHPRRDRSTSSRSTALIQTAAPIAAKLFMGPMMNKALGGLGGPKELNVLGKTITVQVAPSDITFDADGGLVTLDMKMLIEGTENEQGLHLHRQRHPDDGPGPRHAARPRRRPRELDARASSSRPACSNLTMPAQGGTFDGTEIAMTSPPMISADPADGKMRLVLPDMMATFTLPGHAGRRRPRSTRRSTSRSRRRAATATRSPSSSASRPSTRTCSTTSRTRPTLTERRPRDGRRARARQPDRLDQRAARLDPAAAMPAGLADEGHVGHVG